MKIRIVAVLVSFIVLLSCAGCTGAWRRKFVRKKKAVVEAPVLQPQDYSREFTSKQLYANHFSFWKNAEAELISSIESKRGNKRIDSYSTYSMTEIKKLKELLIEEKQSALEPFIKDLKGIIAKVRARHYLNSHRNQVLSRLTKHYRNVSRQFSYSHMKDYIRGEDWEKEQDGPTEVSENAGAKP